MADYKKIIKIYWKGVVMGLLFLVIFSVAVLYWYFGFNKDFRLEIIYPIPQIGSLANVLYSILTVIAFSIFFYWLRLYQLLYRILSIFSLIVRTNKDIQKIFWTLIIIVIYFWFMPNMFAVLNFVTSFLYNALRLLVYLLPPFGFSITLLSVISFIFIRKDSRNLRNDNDNNEIFLPDFAITNKEQDKLNRFQLADKIAKIISSFSGKKSFVIGIEGKWGAGKTSFINLILEQIDKNSIISFKFNPWNFSDEISIFRDFFLKFSEIIETNVGKKASKRIREYAEKLSEIDLGFSYQGFSLKPFQFLGFWKPDTSLETIRQEIDSDLSKLDKKILVVIDDLDRLDKKETELILKLVKLTADFPKTIFILSFDRRCVEDRITEEESGRRITDGGEYLKKIVQVSFCLPLPDHQGLWGIFFGDLNESLKLIYGNAELSDKESSRWSELFHENLSNLLSTVRDIKRYISSLRLDWLIIGKNDVNKVDFICIEIIRAFAPRFYDAIPLNREIFIESKYNFVPKSSEEAVKKLREERYRKLLELINDEHTRKNIDGICRKLFPRVNSDVSRNWEEWERDLRICSPERFDFYFQLGVPSGEIPEGLIDEVIESLVDREAFKNFIIRFNGDNLLKKFLDKLLIKRNNLDELKTKNALAVLWELEKQIDDEKEEVFGLDDVDTQTFRLGYNLIKGLPDLNRKNLLAEIIKECKNIYYPAHLMAVMEQEYQEERHIANPVLTLDELKDLTKILVEKIKIAAADGSLIKEKHLIAILYRWRDWDSGEAVSDYIKNLVSSREGLMAFLKSLVSKVLSSGGNYNDLNKKIISELYNLPKIEKLIGNISEAEISQMDEKGREAISLFKNPPKQW